jgi:hypothetical protein
VTFGILPEHSPTSPCPLASCQSTPKHSRDLWLLAKALFPQKIPFLREFQGNPLKIAIFEENLKVNLRSENNYKQKCLPTFLREGI